MRKLFLDRGIDLVELRRKSRQGKLTQKEYGDFLTTWYNIILSDLTWKTSVNDLVAYLKNGQVNEAILVHRTLAAKPSRQEKTLGKFYVLLFKFICSVPPYDNKQKFVAKLLVPHLEQNGYNVRMKRKENISFVKFDGSGITFFV